MSGAAASAGVPGGEARVGVASGEGDEGAVSVVVALRAVGAADSGDVADVVADQGDHHLEPVLRKHRHLGGGSACTSCPAICPGHEPPAVVDQPWEADMRRLIIGDIHGCYQELCDLIAAAELTDEDEIISVGDLVDRGPDDAAVVRFFQTDPRARAIKGNHELKHIRWRKGELGPALSQRICRRTMGEAAWQDAVDWMETLPNSITLPEALIVHGFFEPGVDLEAQHHRVLCGTMSGQRRLSAYGDHWFEHYDGDKPLIVGHLLYSADQPMIRPGRFYGLDTGCCHGMRLTGLLLPEFRIVSVPARADHWAQTRDRNADIRFVGINPAALSWEKATSVLASLRSRKNDGEAAEKAAEVEAVLTAARQAQTTLLARVEVEHIAAIAAVTVDPSDSRAYARAYAGVIGKGSLTGLLHTRRSRGLTVADLERIFPRPSALLKFVAAL